MDTPVKITVYDNNCSCISEDVETLVIEHIVKCPPQKSCFMCFLDSIIFLNVEDVDDDYCVSFKLIATCYDDDHVQTIISALNRSLDNPVIETVLGALR